MHCRCCEVISLLVSRSPSRLSPPQRGSRRIVVCSQSLSILERGDNGGCWTVDVSRFDHVESDVAGVPRMRVQRGYLGSVPSPHHAAAPDMSRTEGVKSAANVNVNGRESPETVWVRGEAWRRRPGTYRRRSSPRSGRPSTQWR
jgi:hypothetical protein